MSAIPSSEIHVSSGLSAGTVAGGSTYENKINRSVVLWFMYFFNSVCNI